MARLRDIKVGQKIQIVEGKTPLEEFDGEWGLDEFIGRTTTVESVEPEDPFCTVQTGEEAGCFWFPADWIKIIKDEKEKPMKTEEETKTKYAVFDAEGEGGSSDYFEDINQVFDVVKQWEGYDPHEVAELFEKGYYKLIEVKELDVKIELSKPVIKIVG